MFKEFLLTGFTSRKDDYADGLNRLQTEVNGILDTIEKYEVHTQTEERDQARQALIHLEWLVQKFPLDLYQSLKESFYLRRSGLFSDIEISTAESLKALKHKVSGWARSERLPTDIAERNIFMQVSHGLRKLSKKVRGFYGRVRLAVQALFVIPLILSFALGVYYRMGQGFTTLSQDIIWPENAYVHDQGDESRLVYSDAYKQRFWQQFSNFYFEKENKFIGLYFSDEELQQLQDGLDETIDIRQSHYASYVLQERLEQDNRLINSFVCKFVYQNESSTDPALVFQLSAEIERTGEQPFQWSDLDDTPQVELKSEYTPTELFNSGLGPVINLVWSGKSTKGLTIYEGGPVNFHRGYRQLDFAEDIHTVDLLGDTLVQWLWLGGIDPPAVPAGADTSGPEYFEYESRYIKHHGKWYSHVSTAERLCELADCVQGDSVALNYRYESLRGDLFAETAVFSVDSTKIYFKAEDVLFRHDLEQEASAGAAAVELAVRFAEAIAGEPDYLYKPTGTDLMIDSVQVDMNFGATGRIDKNLDVILNPSGYAVIYIKINDLGNGVHRLKLTINEETVTDLSFEYLTPDDFSFQLTDVDWLRERLGVSPDSTGYVRKDGEQYTRK